mgnify:CR=1 FL=1
MSKILGLDLGTNSIGWAVINSKTNQMDCGVRAFKSVLKQRNYAVERKASKKFITISTKVILSSILTFSLFVIALININNWQYWTSLGIGGLLVVISIMKEK